MRDPWKAILKSLSSRCSEATFLEMRCPRCDGKLDLGVHPRMTTFFVQCVADSTHLAFHGETGQPPDWWKQYIVEDDWI